MEKKYILIGIGVVALLSAGILSFPWFSGLWFAVRPVPPLAESMREALSVGVSTTPASPSSTTAAPVSPFTVAAGFTFSLLSDNLPGARVMVQDELGNIWVSQTKYGKITQLELAQGQVVGRKEVLTGLKNPHGLAFDPRDPRILYIATEQALYRYPVYAPEAVLEKVVDFPAGGRHTTRTLLFGADGYLYVSIGSTCDVCFEKDSRLGAISRIDVHAKKPVLSVYATGLRNAVFMAKNPFDQSIWATEMGRDYLGNGLPPDEINIIQTGKNYGWPRCFGKNIHDIDFDETAFDPCQEGYSEPSFIDLPAHSAPLGLAFIPPSSTWPDEWRGNVLVALHGSWNSTVPVGYKVVRLILDAEGRYYGSEDVVTGWLTEKTTFGRPVALVFDQDNEKIYISDDAAGAIYVLQPTSLK
jgi:glucose/arabinose dehydrogenase